MDLLDEIWQLIFREYLDLVKTIRCRMVSKRFKFLIDQLSSDQLSAYDESFRCYDRDLSH